MRNQSGSSGIEVIAAPGELLYGPAGDGNGGNCDGADIAKYFVWIRKFGKLGKNGNVADCG